MDNAVYGIGDAGGPSEEVLFQELREVRAYGFGNPERRLPGLTWVGRRISEGADDRERIENLVRQAAGRIGSSKTAATVEALLGLTEETRGLRADDRHMKAAEIYDDKISARTFRIYKGNALLSQVASRCVALISEACMAAKLPLSEWPPVLIENGWDTSLARAEPRPPQSPSRPRRRQRRPREHPRLFE